MKNKVYSLIAVILIILSCTQLNNPFLPSSLVEHNDQIIDRQTPETRGKEFFLAFSEQLIEDPANIVTLSVFITAEQASSGTIYISCLNSTVPFSLAAEETKEIAIPPDTIITSNDTVENRGIYIKTDNPVTVTGLNQRLYTADSFLVYPVQSLGTEYYAMSYKTGSFPGSNFIIVSAQDSTSVNITPTITSGTRTEGNAYNINLNKFQTYRLTDETVDIGDITGSHITSDKPVALISGHKLAVIPNDVAAGDIIVEQMIPVKYWTNSYYALSLATRSRYTLRILASQDNTTININDSITSTINSGKFFEQIMMETAIITADKPVLSAQFAHGGDEDLAVFTDGDPFMLLLPGTGQFLNNYRFSTVKPSIGFNYINLIVSKSDKNVIKLDNISIDPILLFNINEKYMGAKVPVSAGNHTVTSTNKFGLIIYGFDVWESYGHAGG